MNSDAITAMWRACYGLISLHDVNKDDQQPSREQLAHLHFIYELTQ